MQDQLTNGGGVFLSKRIAGRREFRFALAALLVSAAIFFATAPFARMQLPHVPAFIPAYQAALVLSDPIVAVLLFAWSQRCIR